MHKQTYKHLSSEERDHIAVLRAQGFKASEIARLINRDKGTISREMRRNKSPVYDCYLPHKADERAKERKCKSGQRPRLKNKELMAYTIKKLKLAWSPETISGRWSKEHPNVSISHEAIYQFIYNKKQRKQEDLTVYLPRSHRKRLKRGYSRKHSKSHIPERISIEKRPHYISKRRQSGHWETDTVVSRQSLAALAVLLERKSRIIHLKKIKQKSSHLFSRAIEKRLKPYSSSLKRTITYDNGSENVEHLKTNKKLGTKSYFCNPYHSWEKGAVENAVGLVRRFLPKKTDFATVSSHKIKYIESLLNNRPRKCLNYKTPSEVFNSSVALAR